jgi:type I restriction enzyme R subunit
VEVQRQIDIDSYRIEHTRSGKLQLDQGVGKLPPTSISGGYKPLPDEMEPLSAIIKELNERFGTHFASKDKVFIEQLEAKLHGDAALQASVRVNPPQSARLTFDHVVNDRIQDMINTNFEFYKQVTDNPEFGRLFFDWLFDRYLRRTSNGQAAGKK